MKDNKGINMTNVKTQNRKLILNLLKKSGAASRVDIAKTLQLTPAAITIIVNDMVNEGIIKEIGQLEDNNKKSGRKKVLIDINYDFKYVIGINIEADYINIGVSNIRGEVKIHDRFATDKSISPEVLLKNITSRCMNILWKENILKEQILGIGVGVIGMVNEKEGISIHAYGLWKEKVYIKKILEELLDIRVVVDNNVRALALGEIDYHNNQDVKDILFVKYGPGIGSAIIIDNQIYYGSNNIAGEIGHNIIDYNGIPCKCGKRGCLETVASLDALKNSLKDAFSMEKTPALFESCNGDYEEISINKICSAAEGGGKLERELLEKVVLYMGITIGNTVTIYDPQRVILYGEAFKYNFFIDELKKIISEVTMLHDINIFTTVSVLNRKTNFIGGIALALGEFFYNTGGI